MKLTTSELETVRQRPQQTKLYLSIFQPQTVMQCQVNNASAAKGDRVITYDTVSLGSFAAVEAGMTLLIGTTAGAQDVGRIRIRSVTSTQFTVSENSNINWQDNLFLTVLRYWEVWPVYPRIINDPSNAENVIFYKDYDIPYSNQNSIYGTFINAGPHRAAFLDAGQALLWYSSTGTYNVLGSALSYSWAFEGGTPTGSTLADPGYVSYSVPGQYVTRLIISGSNGEVDTTYRYVSIYDRPENGTHNPIIRWEIGNFDGSRSEGGYNVSLKVYDTLQLDDNAVIVIFGDNSYGSTDVSLGGNYPNSSKIFFVGHVQRDSIHYDYRHNFVEFEAGSVTQTMKNSLGFSVSVGSKAAPATWYEALDMDVRRALLHYLKWHTTILLISDFQFTGDDRKIQYFDADRASMFDAIDNLMRGTLIGTVIADRQGKIWAEVDAQAYTNPTGSFPATFDLSKRDWMNEPVIEERVQDETSYIEYGGIAYSGVVTGTFSALMASAPGNAPSFRGKTENLEGLALISQTQLNQLVANVLANKNSKRASITLQLTENMSNLDIAPQETVNIHVDPIDNSRNLPIDILGILDSITWKYDPSKKILLPDTTEFKPLISGNLSETIILPAVSDQGAGFKVPSINIPPLPVLTIPPALAAAVASAQPEMKRANNANYAFVNTIGTFFSGYVNITTLLHQTPNADTTFVVNIGSNSLADPSFIRVLRNGIYRCTLFFTINPFTHATKPAFVTVDHSVTTPGFPAETTKAAHWNMPFDYVTSANNAVQATVEDVVHIPAGGDSKWLVTVSGDDAHGTLSTCSVAIQLLAEL